MKRDDLKKIAAELWTGKQPAIYATKDGAVFLKEADAKKHAKKRGFREFETFTGKDFKV